MYLHFYKYIMKSIYISVEFILLSALLNGITLSVLACIKCIQFCFTNFGTLPLCDSSNVLLNSNGDKQI